MFLRTLLTSLLMACSFSAMAATEVVPLNYRTSDDLLPVARSFLGKEGTVSAFQNQLIVNAEPEKIQALRSLISQLDKASRRLLISVDTSDSNDQNDQDYATNGSVQTQNGDVNVRSQTQIIRSDTDNREGGVQQVQANEGTPAFIQVGQAVPLTTSQIDPYGHAQNQTQYRNVTQGFYVTASVTGDTVHLAISTNRDRMSQERPDVVNVQSTDTSVSGRLGEWISLAGINRETQADKSSTTRSYSTQGRDDLTLRVKVDTLN